MWTYLTPFVVVILTLSTHPCSHKSNSRICGSVLNIDLAAVESHNLASRNWVGWIVGGQKDSCWICSRPDLQKASGSSSTLHTIRAWDLLKCFKLSLWPLRYENKGLMGDKSRLKYAKWVHIWKGIWATDNIIIIFLKEIFCEVYYNSFNAL